MWLWCKLEKLEVVENEMTCIVCRNADCLKFRWYSFWKLLLFSKFQFNIRIEIHAPILNLPLLFSVRGLLVTLHT